MISFEALGEIMLLESFLDQAIRHALNILSMHSQLDSLQNLEKLGNVQQEEAVDRLECALEAMHSKAAATFSIVNRLYARTGGSEPSDGLRIRSHVYRFLNACFPSILRLEQAADEDMEAWSLWTYIRPHQSPAAIVQMLLDLSTQVAHLQSDSCQQQQQQQQSVLPIISSMWYDLLAHLLAQLALSAYAFKEHTIEDVINAMDIVSPESNSRKRLYPRLWFSESSAEIASFDSEWYAIRELVESLMSAPSKTASSSLSTLASLSPADGFLEKLGGFLELSLDKLEQPVLDLYSGIRQTGHFPRGFFETPDDMVDLPSHPQLIPDNGDTVSDLFSSRRKTSAMNSLDDEANRSPSERAVQSQAYTAMAAISAARGVHSTNADSDLESVSTPGSPTEDVRSQRSRMDFIGRQSTLVVDDSNDLSLDAGMDVENTIVAESPTAFLSARHDQRLLDPIRNKQIPPPALDFNLQSATIVDSEEPEQLPPSKSAVTTPKSEKPRYVSDWIHGDIEGGGRPHRRRHDSSYTPNITHNRNSIISQPPPQTILSPRNIAAAQRKSQRLESLESLVLTPENNRVISSNVQQELLARPQITPEHQIGMSADAKTLSSSRYVVRKEQGDTEGGGRKHRKRQRENSLEPLPL
ncbi:hypothetical protein LPJ64_005399 [Coemansia asiatica]|uniref:Uncharacterized protein n=1 Tax=Coemansia asiatica TaxID=1052880 RepID=A0A9W8CI45_9FUNG|nr:hypothetical protein LPJ64_005399 [Coemansia asiatica]